MNVRIDQLVKSLLRKDSLEQCSLPELRAFADQNPYFGAAQLLLTKKLQQENAAEYESQLQKTYLFFHNPLWVEQLLNDTGKAVVKPAPAKVEMPSAEMVEIQPEQVVGQDEKPVEETPSQIVAKPAEPIEAPGVIIEPETLPVSGFATQEENGISAMDLAETMMNDSHQVEANATAQPQPEIIVPETETGGTMTAFSPLAEAIAAFKSDEPPPPGELTFEAFHTVDYFASQGIKLKDETKPKDKFGQQLKSFTDWLKTMKKLPVAEVAAMAGQGGEKKVVQLAEHSLEEKEVITEAMAEVWEKQGNAAKAIAVYTKLSLLEPAKSPYFAAKIEELKKSN